jgi:hypothetical protein
LYASCVLRLRLLRFSMISRFLILKKKKKEKKKGFLFYLLLTPFSILLKIFFLCKKFIQSKASLLVCLVSLTSQHEFNFYVVFMCVVYLCVSFLFFFRIKVLKIARRWSFPPQYTLSLDICMCVNICSL